MEMTTEMDVLMAQMAQLQAQIDDLKNQHLPILSRRIAMYRKQKGLSQRGLGELVDLSLGSIANIEKGKQRVMVDTLEKFCAVFDVTPNDLLLEKK